MKSQKIKYSVYVCLTAAYMLQGCSSKKPEPKRPAPSVEVGNAISATIPLYIEGIGHVKAYNSAEIKAQVEGELMDVYYEQGHDVQAGQLLALIDPRPYEAQLQEAQGTLIETESNLKFAEDKVMRYTQLVDDNYVSQLNYDEFVTNVQSLLGTLKKNEAAVVNAKINLDYCYIKAPFTGRVGKKLVDKGNLINNDGDTLVLLNQIQPIYLDFSVPERDLMNVFLYQNKEDLKVRVMLPGNKTLEEFGKLIVIDNQVNENTGMIPLRAEFKNEKKLLWPGLFVKAQLVLKEKPHSVLVPEASVNLGQKGSYILVVDQTQVAKIVPVKIGQRFSGLLEVLDGIKPGDKVITTGQLNVLNGAAVNVKKTTETELPESLKALQGQ